MGIKKIILIALGLLCLGLGAVGIFLPFLPTTPFVLLAAACFGGSSPRLYNWLTSSKHFGPFIENYRTKAGVPKALKVKALVFLWVTLGISAAVFPTLHLWLTLGVVGICVSTHILLLKTKID